MTGVFGSFGNRLDDMLRTDFYTFFHLAEAERRSNDDGSAVVRHKPSYAFRDFVDFEVQVDAAGLLRQLTLEVAGSFLDSPVKGGFARDIVRSLISGVLATDEDAGTLQDLLFDLQSRPHAGQAGQSAAPPDAETALSRLTATIDRGEAASFDFGARAVDPDTLPEVGSRGYAVYLGKRASFARDLSFTTVQMTSEGSGDERRLTIRVRRRDA